MQQAWLHAVAIILIFGKITDEKRRVWCAIRLLFLMDGMKAGMDAV